MAFHQKPAHSASNFRRGRFTGIALSALLSCGIVAACAWGVTASLNAMHEAARTLSEGTGNLKVAFAGGNYAEPERKAMKSSRVFRRSETEILRSKLTAEAIRTSYQRRLEAQLALAEQQREADKARFVAALAHAKASVAQEEKASGGPSVVTALLEDVPQPETRPFDLVLATPESEDSLALPEDIPLPEARPLVERATIEQKPAEQKNSGGKSDVAYAKPERSLFGDLFGRKSAGGAWPGKNTKVAIYDVSNATVYLPDGTKLRAHSGIGRMRDNPRYDHVKMTGPTPAGVYRLSMREKRFYGVEAIRMTSIDGRDPKNRTGLLTHTNLLRGQIGSHGCVAFQNYQPFLSAFKRGHVNTLVVVPELPSSSTQLAALYRKAGA